MTRKPIIAGNWKMNTRLADAISLAGQVGALPGDNVDVIVIPPMAYLGAIARAIGGSHVALGAQNLHPAAKGAFTGEVSGSMLKDVGCEYVICGHSERRKLFGDTDAWVGEKVASAHHAGLTPILCVGETLEEREAGDMPAVVVRQLNAGLATCSVHEVRNTVIAYEPVWAIGTGRTASPEQAQEVHQLLRGALAEKLGRAGADHVRIQYGGSVKPQNAEALMAQPDIDGALVGGASLDPAAFGAIIAAAR